jgi:hypothetical protein
MDTNFCKTLKTIFTFISHLEKKKNLKKKKTPKNTSKNILTNRVFKSTKDFVKSNENLKLYEIGTFN